MQRFSNYDLMSIMTPVKVHEFIRMLEASGYDEGETNFLARGFTQGFDIGYRGPLCRQDTSKNIPFQEGVGDKVDMWNKIM